MKLLLSCIFCLSGPVACGANDLDEDNARRLTTGKSSATVVMSAHVLASDRIAGCADLSRALSESINAPGTMRTEASCDKPSAGSNNSMVRYTMEQGAGALVSAQLYAESLKSKVAEKDPTLISKTKSVATFDSAFNPIVIGVEQQSAAPTTAPAAATPAAATPAPPAPTPATPTPTNPAAPSGNGTAPTASNITTPSPTEPPVPVVRMAMTVSGVDYTSLMNNAAVKTAFEDGIKAAIVNSTSGIAAEHIALVLSAGSVVVDATITPPSNVNASSVSSSLETVQSSGALATNVVNNVKAIPNIADVTAAGATIGVTVQAPQVGSSITSSPTAAPEAPAPAPAPSQAGTPTPTAMPTVTVPVPRPGPAPSPSTSLAASSPRHLVLFHATVFIAAATLANYLRGI